MKKIALALVFALSFGIAREYSLDSGWNLLGAVEDFKVESISSDAEAILTYENGEWGSMESGLVEIKKAQGFWFYPKSGVSKISTEVADTKSYILYSPMQETKTYLIDEEKNIVHTWQSSYKPGLAVYMLEDGSIIRAGNINNSYFGKIGGAGGVIERISKDGEVEATYRLSDEKYLQHHDLEPLPNGNVLLIAWEKISREDALANGRSQELLDESGELWSDIIREVNLQSGEVVWEWRVWDHVSSDAQKREKVYIDFVGDKKDLRDWNHINGISYNSEQDLILLSVKNFDEFWVINHSDSSSGILYRYGNPKAVGGSDQKSFFGLHDARWVDSDTITLFNNGTPKDRAYSSVEIYDLPFVDGLFSQEDSELMWSYEADDLYSVSISGATLLPNGNMLITEGEDGRIFEVDMDKNTLWEYSAGGSVFKVEYYNIFN